MKKRMTYFVLVGLLVATVLGSAVLAQVSDNYDLSWHVVSGGGGPMTSSSYALSGTIAQAAIGPADSTNYNLGAGYWYGVRIGPFTIYLPLIVKNY